MAAGIKAKLTDIIKGDATMSDTDAAAKFEKVASGRYATDIFDWVCHNCSMAIDIKITYTYILFLFLFFWKYSWIDQATSTSPQQFA